MKKGWLKKNKGGVIGGVIYIALFFSFIVCGSGPGTAECVAKFDFRLLPTSLILEPTNTFPYPSSNAMVIGLINLAVFFFVGNYIYKKRR